ncbi:MAG: hypothetical protein HY289_04245 [Planctomycetes bacterium]|nr:hypothetical protein [Planctomycetota bacterium]
MTTITLPPEIETPLAEAARQQGTTPEQLALETLRRSFVPKENGTLEMPGETLYDFLKDYIGKFDGTGEAFSEDCGKRFTDALVEKHKKQKAAGS